MDSPSTKPPRRGMEAFASRDFTAISAGRVAVILGAEAQAVAVAWQVYSITHRAIDLGYTGLALFLPGLLFLLPAGHVADRFDRRHVILCCYQLQVFCTLALLALASWDAAHVLYLCRAVSDRHGASIFSAGEFRADSAPGAGKALCECSDLGRSDLAARQRHRAGAWRIAVHAAAGGNASQAGLEGAGIVYIFTLLTLVWFLVLIFSLHVRPGRMEHRAASLEVVLAGFQYVRTRPCFWDRCRWICLWCCWAARWPDADIRQRSAAHGAARAGCAAGGSGDRRAGHVAGDGAVPYHPQGWSPDVCLRGIFGVATVVFGLSKNLWLSLAALAMSGAADMISVIIRGSLLQLATPPRCAAASARSTRCSLAHPTNLASLKAA